MIPRLLVGLPLVGVYLLCLGGVAWICARRRRRPALLYAGFGLFLTIMLHWRGTVWADRHPGSWFDQNLESVSYVASLVAIVIGIPCLDLMLRRIWQQRKAPT